MLALRPCAALPRRCSVAALRRCAPARQHASRARRVRAASEGEGPQEPPKEPAADPSRPASAGRPAYDEDRTAFYGAKPQGPRKPGPAEGRRYGDDGVSGGQYGYGKTVDTAFKYLASEGTFLLGALVILLVFCAVLANGPPPSLLD